MNRAPLNEHVPRLEMHDGIIHLHVDFPRHDHRVINAVGPMVAGCDTGLIFDNPKYRSLSLAKPFATLSSVWLLYGFIANQEVAIIIVSTGVRQ
jgi:hypothetical protein